MAGVKLEEMKDWTCCGATPVHAVDPDLSLALSAKNLAIASGMGHDVAVACAACFSRLKSTAKHLGENDVLRKKINGIAGVEYPGGTAVKHLLTIFRELGQDRLRAMMSKKLDGLNVACYYGCLLLRPPKVMEFDDAENPTIMESLLSLTGAAMVEWNFRTECCGASFAVPETDIVLKLCNDILADAKKRGADVVAVACPLCQMNLDMRQKDVERKYGAHFGLPVMYFTQLLGLAMGLSPDALGLGKLITSPAPILKEKNLI
jgi:heterodisulfide reductase subunit B